MISPCYHTRQPSIAGPNHKIHLILLTLLHSQGAFTFSQSVLPQLLKTASSSSSTSSGTSQHPPTLIFTGATASLKGSAKLAPFAAGKTAQRALAQSIAREFGPQGVHVSHVIIDGIIDTEGTKGVMDDAEKIAPETVSTCIPVAAKGQSGVSRAKMKDADCGVR